MPANALRKSWSFVRSDALVSVIGLDIGGTKIAAGIVRFPAGEILCRRVVPTRPEREGEMVLQDTVDLASELMAEASKLGICPAGIGAGVAELVGPDGEITSGQTIRWNGMPVRERLSRVAPAIVEADVRAAALGEALLGAGGQYAIFVYVTVGTGISCALVREGCPYGGARGNALVLGSAPLSHTCPACGVRSHPVLEEFATGPALARRYSASTRARVTSGEEVMALVEAGDCSATEIVRTSAEALGVSVGFLVNVMDPEAVIVGGGLGSRDGLYWTSFVESTRAHIWAEASRQLPILRAGLGTDAGLIGAAAAFCRFSANSTTSKRT